MVALLASAIVAPVPTEIEAYVQKEFRDASFGMRIVRKNQKALASINKDFAQSFGFDRTQFRMKEPYKLRLDTNFEDTTVSYIIDGTTQRLKIPKARVNTKRDLSKSPGSRQTPLDFGFLTPSLFGDLFDAKFVQADPAQGTAAFDLTYKPGLENATRFRVWLHPVSKAMMRREWYDRAGKLIATFEYDTPKAENGGTIPTHMTVRNAAGEIAGETRLDEVRINRGVDDAVFGG